MYSLHDLRVMQVSKFLEVATRFCKPQELNAVKSAVSQRKSRTRGSTGALSLRQRMQQARKQKPAGTVSGSTDADSPTIGGDSVILM